MISQKQREANRLNAQKSTGPKTPEGKAASSRNASKHNLYTQEPVVYSCGETDEMYNAHRDALVASLRPQDYVQQLIVEDIASVSFRIQRIRRMEAGHLDARAEATYNATIIADRDGTKINPFYDGWPTHQDQTNARLLGDTAAQVTTCTKLLPEIWRQEQRLRKAWQQNLKLLKELQSEPAPEPALAEPEPLPVEPTEPVEPEPENEAEFLENKAPAAPPPPPQPSQLSPAADPKPPASVRPGETEPKIGPQTMQN